MAIIFEGKTKCALCGKVISEKQNIIGLPAISNTKHILYKYFDCGFHQTCFENWDKKQDIFKILQEEKVTF